MSLLRIHHPCRVGSDSIKSPSRRRRGCLSVGCGYDTSGQQGRFYRLPLAADLAATKRAEEELARRQAAHSGAISLVPDEVISLNELRRISVPIYGMERWGDLFSPRQSLALSTLARLVAEAGQHIVASEEPRFTVAVQTLLALTMGRQADATSSLARWHVTRELITGTFGRQALGMVWDFSEVSVLSESTGGFPGAVEWVTKVIEANVAVAAEGDGHAQIASATAHLLPDGAAQMLATDPPYYDAVPYAYLSDFFYVWLRRSLGNQHTDLFSGTAVPKDAEIVVDRPHSLSQSNKDVAFYERELCRAFAEGRRVVANNGIGVIVFASKTTASWEAILKAVIDAGWIITGSWPIDTEMDTRVSAQGQARLASSVHIVCRPRNPPLPPFEKGGLGGI